MFDAMIGTWRADPSNYASGVSEYLNAVGQGELIREKVTCVIKKMAANKFSVEFLFDQRKEKTFEIFEIGAKSKSFFVGPGMIVADTVLEGGKFVSRAIYNGQPLTRSLYAENGNLCLIATFGSTIAEITMTPINTNNVPSTENNHIK